MAASELELLRSEIGRLVAAAVQAEIDHVEARRVAESEHDAELATLVEAAQRTADQVTADGVHIEHLHRALQSRDVIGQAKGVLMVTMRCAADQAFAMLVKQSQHENRKLVDVAGDVVAAAERVAAST